MSATGPYSLGFETVRLRARALSVDDEAHYRDLYTDAHTMRFIAPPLSTDEAAGSFRKALLLQAARTLSSRFLVIEEKETSRRVGICGTSNYDSAALRVEVGVVLTPEFSSRGLAREALGALMKKIFEVSLVNEIWVECSTLHPAVERMVAAVGFTACGDEAQTVGPLASRKWSAHRSSWYVDQIVNFNRYQGMHMSNVISFLERMGADARLSRAAGEEIGRELSDASIAPELMHAVISRDESRLRELLDQKAYCCMQFPVKEAEEDAEEAPSRDDEEATLCCASQLMASAA